MNSQWPNSNFRNEIYLTLATVRYVDGAASQRPEEIELKHILVRFLVDEGGATAIEYGLIAAGISLAIIAVVNGIGTNLSDKYTSINSSLK